jgi:hypothetical protein
MSLEYFRNCIPHSKIGTGRALRFRDPSLPENYKSRKKGSRYDNSCVMWDAPKSYGGFRVHSHRCPEGWKELKDWVCQQIGIEPFKPKPRGPFKPTNATYQILAETIAICKEQPPSEERYVRLVMDYRLAGHPKDRIKEFVALMGMSDADFERAWAIEPRTATAKERAVIGGLTHEQFKRLDIHRSGCAEKTAAERRRSRWITRMPRNGPGQQQGPQPGPTFKQPLSGSNSLPRKEFKA